MEKKRDSFFMPNKKANKDKEKKHELKNKRQEKFDDNRAVQQNGKDDEKKPFDKKTYRLKKYSKKYKLEQWEKDRKKKMYHNLQKELKKESMAGSYKAKSFDEDTTDSNQEFGKFVRHPDLIEKEKTKKNPFQKAKDQYNKVKQEKIDKQQEIQKSIEERNKKMQEYKKKKHEKFKKLSKKNKKGQPVMGGRLELLLEKIQSSQ